MKQQLLIQNVIVRLEMHILQELNEIIMDKRFQKMAALWIWLQSICNFSDVTLKIKIIPIRLYEVNNDFEYASRLESSNLFEKLHLQEYEQAGGEPFGLLLIDFVIQRNHLKILKSFMSIGQQAFLPILYNTDNDWWDLELSSHNQSSIAFTELFQQLKYQEWRDAFKKPAAMFCFAAQETCILTTMPSSLTVFASNFVIKAPSSYQLIRIFLENYKKHNWFYDQEAASSQQLLTHTFWQQAANPNDPISKNTLTFNYSPQQINDLININILVLQQTYPNETITCECASLMTLLALSRFAHYLKIILREVIGAYIDLETVERVLAHFLNKYCVSKTTEKSLLQYPLRFYQVKVQKNTKQTHKLIAG